MFEFCCFRLLLMEHRVGCTLVANNSWPSAPITTPILGLKELPSADTPLSHAHIQFAHCYKNQAGWSQHLSRFARGNGTLYDLEFLTDDTGRRVAAFGYHAGFAGAAVGALAFAAKVKGGLQLDPLRPYVSEEGMVNDVREGLGAYVKGLKIMVMGALGRCGGGAIDLFKKIGVSE